MSKAFAPGESDDDEERIITKRPLLPPGTPNYMTPEGAARLEAQCDRLVAQKKALGDTVESKERARAIQRQVDELTERLNAVQILDLSGQNPDQVRFGATVTVQAGETDRKTWRIVGVDEVDLTQGWLSWISPLARLLLDKRVGDSFQQGDRRWVIEKIVY